MLEICNNEVNSVITIIGEFYRLCFDIKVVCLLVKCCLAVDFNL